MKQTAALLCATIAIATMSCGKGSQSQLQTATPTKQGRLVEKLRDPKNYAPFFYNEKQKPATGKAAFRYIVTRNPTRLSLPSLSADFYADADMVIVLREKNKYQAFIATYLNCAEAAAMTPANITTPMATLASSEPAAVNSANSITQASIASVALNTAPAAMPTKTKRGVLIDYQDLGAEAGGLDWNITNNKLVLVGLGQGTKTVDVSDVHSVKLLLNLTFNDAFVKAGYTNGALLSTRLHVKSYEEFHANAPTNFMKLTDIESRIKDAEIRLTKDCQNVDADVFKFDALPAPNPTPPPAPLPKRPNPVKPAPQKANPQKTHP